MYTLKKIPEDFIVREIPLDFKSGSATICLLKKKNYTTTMAVQIIRQILGISKIGFAGNKDKNAITEQYISIDTVSDEKISAFSHPDISLEIVGKGSMLHLGDLQGNDFEITVRNVNSKISMKEHFVNYFGEQRFSSANVSVGRALIKKDFKRAVELIVESNHKETMVEEHLAEVPTDYIGALKKLDSSILSLYINAYQSYLWNESVSMLISGNKKINIGDMSFSIGEYNSKLDILLPLVGFETEDLDTYPVILDVLKQEGITTRDFIFPQFKQLSAGGAFRNVFAKASDCSVEEFPDELSLEKKKFVLKFKLPKSSYATTYIAQLFI